jgi:hypothetical protein
MSDSRKGKQAADMPLYRVLLGEEWDRLPAAVAALHDVSGDLAASGRADIVRGKGLLAWFAASLAGFPDAAEQTEITVQFAARNGVERWTRRFGGKVFRSTQCAVRRGGDIGPALLLAEDLGPFRILTEPVIENNRLLLKVRGWRLAGLPLPMMLAPDGLVYEEERDGRFHFHVEVRAPLIGLIVRYTGWMVPESTSDGPQLPAIPSSSESSALR